MWILNTRGGEEVDKIRLLSAFPVCTWAMVKPPFFIEPAMTNAIDVNSAYSTLVAKYLGGKIFLFHCHSLVNIFARLQPHSNHSPFCVFQRICVNRVLNSVFISYRLSEYPTEHMATELLYIRKSNPSTTTEPCIKNGTVSMHWGCC